MSVNRPQTTSIAFAILTLFAATAWGQENVTDIPIYKSDEAIFGAHTFPTEDIFQKVGLEQEVQGVAQGVAKAVKQGPRNIGAESIDSLFAQSEGSLVDENGYFLPTAEGEVWKGVGTENSAGPGGNSNRGPNQSTVPANGFDSLARSKFRLRVGFDALIFERGSGENEAFAIDTAGNDITFNDFDFSEGDVRYFIQFMGDDQSGFEFTFFDIDSFSSNLVASGEDLPVFFQGTPATPAATYALNYTSRLKNLELNLWVRQNEFQRSAWGLRYINLDENFDIITGGTNGLFSRADNDLWGFSRMWERRRPVLGRMSLVGGLDVGGYINNVELDVDTLNIDDSSQADNIAATLGFNIGGEYRVADHVTLRVGYEGLGIFGVGLASTQSLEQDIFDGLDDPELSSIYFGGFYIGAIAAF